MIVTKRLDLGLLERELAAADVVVSALGTHDLDGGQTDLYTFDEDGLPDELPPAAVPVVDSHVAPPKAIDYAGARPVDAIVTTTDEQPRVVFRFPTTAKSVYRGTFRMTAVDRGSGATKDTEARMVFKRTAAALVQVGATAVLATFQDAAATSWAISPTVDGTELVISVRGAAGRTVDWFLEGSIGRYAPEGID